MIQMISLRHGLFRCLPKIAAVNAVTICAIALASLQRTSSVFAAEDDWEAIDREQQVPMPMGAAIHRFANPKIREVDQFVFGNNAMSVRGAIEADIDRAVREFILKYDLSENLRTKVVLAALADKVRFFKQVDDLQIKFKDVGADPVRANQIMAEAAKLRQKRNGLLTSDSFFGKVTTNILAADPSLNDRNYVRHLSNIESAIRAISRNVVLLKPQRDALFRLMLKEIRPPSYFGDFDDVVVKYRLSQLPNDKLTPLFEQSQWPMVAKALDGFREFGPVLAHHHLIESDGVPEQKPAEAPKLFQRQIAEKFQKADEEAIIRWIRVEGPARKIAAQEPVKPQGRAGVAVDQALIRNRHRANIEAAIREIERSVDLREPQRDAVLKLLMEELPVPKKVGNFDDLVVRYQISQMPEDKLKSLFDKDQWPKVLLAIESIQLFKQVLVDNGLIDPSLPKLKELK